MNRAGFILAVESWLVRKGMVTLLNRIPGTVVVRELSNADGLEEYLRHHEPDCLIISQGIFEQVTDFFLSRASLLERTILITEGPDKGDPVGVQASIHTGDSKEQMIMTIRGFLESRFNLSDQSGPGELTPREKTIIRQVALGLTNKQIAGQLFLSTHTVITHRKNISAKLGIKSVSGLTIYAIVNNIITIEEVTSKPER